ncbi:hypothetical protein ACLQ18_40920 [Streptomyces sp. DT193]|uniref:hypothetical protein n=1 Tax=Streptomyces sp. DT193 TaxID=3393418 RepID=UPI003CEB75D1
MIEPSAIPQFTGDFDQLDKDTSGLRSDAIGIRNGGMDVHSRFQMLEAFYTAPEADDLFATTRPVMDKADTFAAQLETVADALDTYSVEARPIAEKLARLKTDAFAFVESVEGDDDWTYDGDKIHRHQELMDGVAAAESAFREAERRAAGKISALVGGPEFVVDDGHHTVDKKTVMYGYDLDVLKHAEKTPWGTPESESHHAWEVGYWAKSFVWDGLVVDNIWGGIKGLGTLVGWNGSDAAGDAWGHLGDVVSGIGQYTATPYDALMDWAIGPDKESATEVRQKKAAKDFAKSLVAWDMWSENPARAAATVVFNGLTLGSGPLAVASKGGEAGAVAKSAGVAAKVGQYIDPVVIGLKATGKAVGALPKLSDLTAGIRGGIGASADAQRVHSVIELGDGSKVVIEDGRFIPVDRHGDVIGDTPRREASADARSTPEESPAQPREPATVGASSHTPGTTAHAGEASGGRGATHPVGPRTSGSGTGPTGSGRAGTGAGAHGGDGLDDLGRSGDDAMGDGTDGVSGPDRDTPGQHTDVERPGFMREGPNPYGPRGSLSLEQIEKIQVYRANHEPGYRDQYYRKDGTRRLLEHYDESGYTPPQLTRPSENVPWTRAKDAPAPPAPHFLDDDFISVRADSVTSKARRHALEMAARTRHLAIKWDNLVSDWKADTGKAHELHGTIDTAAQWGEARGAYKESHTLMGEKAEDFGEAAARYHYMAESHPGFTDEPLLGPKSGNDQFDQVWTHEDGRVVVIEAKSSPTTELGRRTLPNGRQVSQGSREYFYDIIDAMEKRGEFDLAETLDKALSEGKLEYVVVKGEKNAGTYTGYKYRRFDISKGTLP